MGKVPDDSFDEFVRGRSTALLRSAYLLTTDRHAAEDLVQEVLERVYVKWKRISGAPEAYARRTLVNQAINRWRSRRRRPEAPLFDDAGPASPDHAVGLVSKDVVLAALRALPPRQRTAVVLRYLDDMSEADTAALMGCSVGTVKSHTSRALAKLRGVLDPSVPMETVVGPTGFGPSTSPMGGRA